MNTPYSLSLLLFFFSGVTGLIYEVLWLKQLGLLFGNAAYAMATTLAAFFSGLTLGGYQWGKRVKQAKNPLRLYAYLELGVAVCALGYFAILSCYAWLYPQLFTWFGAHQFTFIGVKFMLAMIILFPPAWFMGGTLPVISQYVVRQSAQLGQKVSLLYAANTLGAVLGVLLAGFYLPRLLGFTHSYYLAISMTLCIALTAWFFAKDQGAKQTAFIPQQSLDFAQQYPFLLLAYISGFLMLALQVLWGRMFAQVLQNSVYTFAIVLIVFLLCLAVGSLLANRLMRLRTAPHVLMFWLLLAGAFMVAVSPTVFFQLTHNLHFVGGSEGWWAYIGHIMLLAFQVIGVPIILLGCVFPFLLKCRENNAMMAGAVVGQLVAVNNFGAMCGSLLAGFVILDSLGLWAGIRLTAVIYCITAWLWLQYHSSTTARLTLLPALLMVLLVSVLDTSRLPVVKVDPLLDQESLLQVWEGSSGTVAVIKQGLEVKLKVNNYYTLGGSASFELEQLQGYLPLLLHENPQAVYVLGLGSGITAGGSLLYPIKKLLVTELIPEVVNASETYFADYTNSLFYDPRVRIVAEDGRNYLRGSHEPFDVIISDLFVPWKAGVGNLYALEHYQIVKQRLNEHGLFMQWLPAYQLSMLEFEIISRTMLAVFPQVTVWRGDFGVLKPVIGLVGHKAVQPLSKQAWMFSQKRAQQANPPWLTYYVGELQNMSQSFADTPLNTDDKPIIEFQAPITQRLSKAGHVEWLAGEPLIEFMRQAVAFCKSFYLSELEAADCSLPEAGLHLHFANLLRQQGKLTVMEKEKKHYLELLKR